MRDVLRLLALAACVVCALMAGRVWSARGTDDAAMAHVLETHPEFEPRRVLADAPDEQTISAGLLAQGAAGALLFGLAWSRMGAARRSSRP